MGLQGSCAQPEVTSLHLHGGLSSYRTQEYFVILFLEEEPGPCPKAALLFLDCFSLVSAFPLFPD